jgi:acyl carrier protein
MTEEEFRARLRRVFVEVLDQPGFTMEPALKVGDVGGWDSFAHINLMLGIEAEFKVEFDSDEIGTLRSIGQISGALQQRLGLSAA